MTSKNILNYPSALCNQVIRFAREAGEILMEHFDESGGMAHDLKSDGSPVTHADVEAENFIIAQLKQSTPDVPIIAEESVIRGDIPDFDSSGYAWLVDALDGTRGFIDGNPDFTVNIGLIKNGEPILGVVYAPALGELYASHGLDTARRVLDDQNSEKHIRVRKPLRKGLTVAVSNFKGNTTLRDQYLEQFKVTKLIRRPSSIKLCLVASGKADLSIRFKEISQWDTAAADAIIRAAGGLCTDPQGNVVRYLQAGNNFTMNGFFASSGYLIFDFPDNNRATP